MKKISGALIYSPSDLVRYLESPFSTWMDRYYLEHPGSLIPDELSEDAELIIKTGEDHEQAILNQLRGTVKDLYEISREGDSLADVLEAIQRRHSIIYQAKLESGDFAGYADFIILDQSTDRYQIWDTKLARSPKPYYAIQLCCYSELLGKMTGEPMPEKFGLILGADAHGISERVEFRTEDFIHYYRHLKQSFLKMQDAFDGDFDNRPIPDPRADHGRWQTHADKYLDEKDHLVRVAGISAGQIKKLNEAGIGTLTALAETGITSIPKMPSSTLGKLVHQALLQKETRELRRTDKNAIARFDILPSIDDNGSPIGLGALPEENPGDVYFDMEGFPLIPGGLEYLFGNTTIDLSSGEYEFTDFWAHGRKSEKLAFEQFIDWVYDRWLKYPGMHIYHYAPYEVTAVRRLSTFHDTRQDEVDELLRHEVFVDLYKIVRQGVRVGEESYSLKKVERIYWPQSRTGVVTLSIGSVVHYARWMESGEPGDWQNSPILKEIRDYNKDDCDSTAELAKWLRRLAADNGIPPSTDSSALRSADQTDIKEIDERTAGRLEIAHQLREKDDDISNVLAHLVDFHRREGKPVWWKFFERCSSESEILRDDNGCIAEVEVIGKPVPEKRSLLQEYRFDPAQECKLSAGSNKNVVFSHAKETRLNLFSLDLPGGTLQLKAGPKTLDAYGGEFPSSGSLVPDEYVNPDPIPEAVAAVAGSYLNGSLNPAAESLLKRKAPPGLPANEKESTTDLATRVGLQMNGDCLIIQGPPGTGKTYTASHMIAALLAKGKKVGITSNGHKAIMNLVKACGHVLRENGQPLVGVKAGDNGDDTVFEENPYFLHRKTGKEAYEAFSDGIIAGTAWLFSRADWDHDLDYLFVDEAGQVPLANVVAMTHSTKNLVMLGDQMQLEQPIQGSHPGDAKLSALQYALKDIENSQEDAPVFHSVVPDNYGIFLGETRRMHPSVCDFISESVYNGRLHSHPDCARQAIDLEDNHGPAGTGIAFYGIEHDGNIQASEEEVEQVLNVYKDLVGRSYTDKDGVTGPLELSDFLFITPYNAQVRALEARLPFGARVGSVDKFQGQEAPVCILSLCSSFGEYGSRGIGFILNQNRINVAISRAKCTAIVVADPRIATTATSSIETMKLLNLFCKLLTSIELAR
jgi:predicted RecB family nuclease